MDIDTWGVTAGWIVSRVHYQKLLKLLEAPEHAITNKRLHVSMVSDKICYNVTMFVSTCPVQKCETRTSKLQETPERGYRTASRKTSHAYVCSRQLGNRSCSRTRFHRNCCACRHVGNTAPACRQLACTQSAQHGRPAPLATGNPHVNGRCEQA